jgi:hypothetical protein
MLPVTSAKIAKTRRRAWAKSCQVEPARGRACGLGALSTARQKVPID